MSIDLKMKRSCGHYVNNKQYEPEKCPRCYGQGWFWDLTFDSSGKLLTVKDEEKLDQDLAKLLSTNSGDNQFYTIGHDVGKIVGRALPEDFVRSYVRKSITTVIANYKALQDYQESYQEVSSREKVRAIRDIIVTKVDGQNYKVLIAVSNKEQGTISVSVGISL